MNARIVTKRPNECSAPELQDFRALLLADGEVTAAGLGARIRKAERLIFLVQDSCLKAIAALKNPDKHYREGVFKKAQATVETTLFPFELGWVFVLPSSRGAGFSHTLLEAVLSAADGPAVFATSRADNEAMYKVLKAHGFSHHGITYASTCGGQEPSLFVRSAD